jgi:hypothetical protein
MGNYCLSEKHFKYCDTTPQKITETVEFASQNGTNPSSGITELTRPNCKLDPDTCGHCKTTPE